VNDDKLRQVHAAIESLKLPTNKRASIEQMVADGTRFWQSRTGNSRASSG